MKYAYLISDASNKGCVTLHEHETQEIPYEELKKILPFSMIQIVNGNAAGTPVMMIINDNGKLECERVNLRCSMIYGSFYDCIVGNALIGKQIMTDEGPDVGCFTLHEAQKLEDMINNDLDLIERMMR